MSHLVSQGGGASTKGVVGFVSAAGWAASDMATKDRDKCRILYETSSAVTAHAGPSTPSRSTRPHHRHARCLHLLSAAYSHLFLSPWPSQLLLHVRYLDLCDCCICRVTWSWLLAVLTTN